MHLTYHNARGSKDGDIANVTPEMLEAGEAVILAALGGADLGGFFSAAELAAKVYRAMAAAG